MIDLIACGYVVVLWCPSYERAHGSHHRVSCMLIGLCLEGKSDRSFNLAQKLMHTGLKGDQYILMLWLGFTLMNVSSCRCLLIVPIISAQNSKSGMTCQQWPLPHKTCYRSSKVINCLGTISQLLPPLFHTLYTNFIASLPKTAPSFYLRALYILANLSRYTYKVLLVSYLFQVKRTLSMRRVVSVVDRT